MFPLAFFEKVFDLRLDWFGKLSVTPISRPGYFELCLDCIGSSLPALTHARVRSGPRMIMNPTLFRPCAFGRDAIPWWNIVWSLMHIMDDPSFHVYWRQYPWMFLAIIISMIFSSLLSASFPKTLTFWFSITHVCAKVSLGRLPFLKCPTTCGLSIIIGWADSDGLSESLSSED